MSSIRCCDICSNSKITRIIFRLIKSNLGNKTPSQIRQWLRKPFQRRLLLRATRLGGISFGFAFPLIRKTICQPLTSGEISRRAEYLSKKASSGCDPQLTFSDIWKLLKPYFGWFLAAVLSAVLAAVLNIKVPILLGELVNAMSEIITELSQNGIADLGNLRPISIKLLLAYAAQALMTFLYITFLSVMGERMAADLRRTLFEKLLLQDMGFYDVQRTGELNARLSADVQEFKSCFKLTVAQGLRTIAQVGGCVVSMYLISPKMTIFTMSIMPAIILVGSVFGALLRGVSRAAQAQNGVSCAVADEAFANIRTVRAFAMEKQEIELFRMETEKARILNEYLGLGIGLFQGATNFFLNGIILAVLLGGSSLISSQELDAGGLMSFLVTSQTIQKSLGQLSIVFGQAVKGWTAGARVFEFINMVPTIPLNEGGRIPYYSLVGGIEFDSVSFVYPSRPGHVVLKGLDLVVQPGKVLAVCGPSGEGKSTLVALLERFYEPVGGRVLLDGRDIRKLDASWLRGKAIGLISQEPVLFATSIKENIRYGRPKATDQEVKEAAVMANADGFINEFPDGYDTLVGERGVTLSGGQKQRVAIARALLKNPPILILDEATSALDSESERQVQEALDRAMRGRTVIIIAHRLSTIQFADSIALIKNGRIAEKGTHEELMARKGLYYELVRLQYQTT